MKLLLAVLMFVPSAMGQEQFSNSSCLVNRDIPCPEPKPSAMGHDRWIDSCCLMQAIEKGNYPLITLNPSAILLV